MNEKKKLSAKLLIFGIFILAVGVLTSFGLIMFGGAGMILAAWLPPTGSEDDPF